MELDEGGALRLARRGTGRGGGGGEGGGGGGRGRGLKREEEGGREKSQKRSPWL